MRNGNRHADTENRHVLPRGRRSTRGLDWELGLEDYIIYGMDKQQGPIIQHREL